MPMDETSDKIPVSKAAQYADPEEHHTAIWKKKKICDEAYQRVHSDYVADHRFADGDQWDDAILKYRESNNLTSLTYNQIPAKRRFIVNNARMNDSAIKCNPVTGGASKNTAKIFDGIIKHIQYKYNAKDAYIMALDCAVVGGLGAWRVMPVQTDDGFDIEIQRITDPTTVMMDPNSKKQNFSDAEYCFVSSLMSKDDFKLLYPEAQVDDPKHSTNFTKDSVQVYEYWCKNHDTNKVEQYIITESEILESNVDYRGKYIPIIFFTGEEIHIEGERWYKGIVRDIKDIQLLLNLTKSRTADYIQRSSNEQWLVAGEQITGHESDWEQSNLNGKPVKIYNPKDGVPPPQRLDAPPPPTGYMQVSQEADADLRAAMGIRDPLAELPDNVATETMQMHVNQGNIGTYAYTDKWNSAKKWTGDILVDLIPHYFSYPHIREIMGTDGNVSTVQLNQPYQENGEQVLHDLSVGAYSVILKEGPSYESRRSEALGKLIEIAKTVPNFWQLYGDIAMQLMDFDGAEDVAARMRASVPPAILAASSASNADSQNAGAQLAHAMQQLHALQQENAQLKQNEAVGVARIREETHGKLALQQNDHAHQLRLEQIRLQGKAAEISDKGTVDRGLIEAQKNADAQLDILDGHIDTFHKQLDHDHDVNRQEARDLSPRSVL
jgi:hypothetical protein